MYEFEIRNGIDRNSHLGMSGIRSEVVRYLKDDYSGGSVKKLLDGRKSSIHVISVRIMGRTGGRAPVFAGYSTG